MIKKIVLIILLIIIMGCSKINNKGKKILKKIKLEKMFTLPNNKIESINSYCFSEQKYAIFDLINFKINILSNEGNIICKFGEKGKAPGEFLSINRMMFFNDKIIITDPKQKKILIFNENGKYIKSLKRGNRIFYSIFQYNNFILASYMEYYPKGSELWETREIALLDSNFIKVKSIYNTSNKLNPYLIDPNKFPSLTISTKNNIFYTHFDDLSYSLYTFENNREKKVIFDKYLKKYYSKKEYHEIFQGYKEFKERKEKLMNKKIKLLTMKKETRAIKGLAIDKLGNIWISTPINNTNKVNLYLYNEDFKKVSEVIKKISLGKIYIIKDYLYNISGSNDSNIKLDVYKINY